MPFSKGKSLLLNSGNDSLLSMLGILLVKSIPISSPKACGECQEKRTPRELEEIHSKLIQQISITSLEAVIQRSWAVSQIYEINIGLTMKVSSFQWMGRSSLYGLSLLLAPWAGHPQIFSKGFHLT